MRIEIDQSNKIEQTSKLTVIAYSNGISRSIVITSTEKKIVQKQFRAIGKNKLFVVLTFCALIYLLLKDIIDKNLDIYIDKEYPGYDQFIRQQLVEFSKSKLDRSQIHIIQVSKKSRAHKKAHRAMTTKNFDLEVNAQEIIKLLPNKKPRST